MAIVYRYIKGSNLTAAEVDGNFQTVEAQIAAKAAQGVGVSEVALLPDNMLQFQLTDHSYLPPVGPLPMAQYRFRGNWSPSTAYLVNDTFSEGSSGYVVLVQHTSATTFDPNATDGSGHNLYGLYFAAVSSLPAGGATGAALVKATSADFAVAWQTLTLAGLSDVTASPAPDTGDLVYWNGTHFSYLDQSSVGSGVFLPLGGGTLTGGLVVQGPADLLAQTVTQSGGTLAINRVLGEVVRVSLTASITAITVVGWPAAGTLGKITLMATNGGAFTIGGWPTGTIWPGGTAPTLTSGSGKKDVFVLMSPDGGTTIYGSVAGQNYA